MPFDRAKEQAYGALQNERVTGLPLMRSYLDETVSLFGADPWSYGLERNWKGLDQFLTHAHYQGLTNNKLNPEELFDNTPKGRLLIVSLWALSEFLGGVQITNR